MSGASTRAAMVARSRNIFLSRARTKKKKEPPRLDDIADGATSFAEDSSPARPEPSWRFRSRFSKSPEGSASSRASASLPHPRSPAQRKGLWRLAGIVTHPINLILPIDHQMIFKTSVGAAKGSGPLRDHVSRLLESWIVVGTLILGVGVGLLALPTAPLGVYRAGAGGSTSTRLRRAYRSTFPISSRGSKRAVC
jgi:hypothetical protein